MQRAGFDDGWGSADEAPQPLHTTVTNEQARSVINRNQSPDLPFNLSINPYRGCEHGCVYCYARPAHAYVDLSPGLDFESRLFAKPDAAAVLKRELAKPGYRCESIALGANTDAYQPIERKLGITRAIIEVLAECSHPFSIVTKSALVERDIDLLAPLAARDLVQVFISVTTLDRELARRMEPRAAAPQRRLAAMAELARAGVPVAVLAAPMIPGINDAELERILNAAAGHGATHAGYVLLRLPLEIAQLFEDWLKRHYPERAARVLALVRETRGGQLYDSRFGIRQSGTGPYADMLAQRFAIAMKRLGLDRRGGGAKGLDCTQFRVPDAQPKRAVEAQMALF